MAFFSQSAYDGQGTADQSDCKQDKNTQRKSKQSRSNPNRNSQLHYHKILSHKIVKDSHGRLSESFDTSMEGKRPPNIFFLSPSASVTIETALAVTFFLIFFVSVIHLFFLMDLQIRVQKTLEQLSDETVKACYLDSSYQEIAAESLRLRFLSLMGEKGMAAESAPLGNGMWSEKAGEISFSKSDINPENGKILLAVTYPVNLPVGIPGLGRYMVTQYSCRYGWTGTDTKKTEEAEADGQAVYVTADSQVYHLSADCTHLRLSVHMVNMAAVWSLENSDGRKYTACELCEPKKTEEWIYITDHGDRYHRDKECRGLKRAFQAIPLSEIGERRLCSRCGQTAQEK